MVIEVVVDVILGNGDDDGLLVLDLVLHLLVV